jgi:hypothetical protein
MALLSKLDSFNPRNYTGMPRFLTTANEPEATDTLPAKANDKKGVLRINIGI